MMRNSHTDPFVYYETQCPLDYWRQEVMIVADAVKENLMVKDWKFAVSQIRTIVEQSIDTLRVLCTDAESNNVCWIYVAACIKPALTNTTASRLRALKAELERIHGANKSMLCDKLIQICEAMERSFDDLGVVYHCYGKTSAAKLIEGVAESPRVRDKVKTALKRAAKDFETFAHAAKEHIMMLDRCDVCTYSLM